ncbi:MAG: MBL fold metallo-hydrolase [bacterium]
MNQSESNHADFIKFLGTGGARFVVSQQMRASGGIWLSFQGTKVHIDPGPGALVRCLASRPRLDPLQLDGIILTHRHLDHAADVNIMIEAMTKGGFQRKGTVFAPADALEHDPVVLRYVRSYLGGIETLSEGGSYALGSIRFSTPIRHNHPVETYGLKIDLAGKVISLIADTLFFDELASHYYQSDCLIINVVRLKSSDQIIYHLCLEDAERIMTEVRPRRALLTHFGSQILQAKPWLLAEELSQRTGIQVTACADGMRLSMDELVG